MRTNAIDSTAFRCLQEVKNLVAIYGKLFKKDYDYHVNDYLEELIECETLKEIREKHEARLKFINDRIDAYIEGQKKKVSIGGLFREDTAHDVGGNRVIYDDDNN